MSPISITDLNSSSASSSTSTTLNGLTNGSSTQSKEWNVEVSKIVQSIRNPIREVMSTFDFSSNDSSSTTTTNGSVKKEKKLLNLGLGDPSVFGNMPPPIEAIEAIEKSLRSGKSDGYPESIGYAIARQAVASYFSSPNWEITKDDVVLTFGASGALDMAIAVLTNSDSNVLVPKPLFSAYLTMIATTQAETRYYNLIPENNWEVDLAQMESLIDDKTAFILINNPSNPTGSNWSEAHLRQIAAVASKHRIPVIADEVYAGMAWSVSDTTTSLKPEGEITQGKFNRGVFTPFASVSGDVPVLVTGAISKRWLAPGYRTGFVILKDPSKDGEVMKSVRDGLGRWAFRIQGPNSTVQRALPDIFENTPEKFFKNTLTTLESVSIQLFERLSKIEGLNPLLPQGAMYLVCGGLTQENFPAFKNDREFTQQLLLEESVLILPGECFMLEGFMRFVTTVPIDILLEACDRIEAFCGRHRKVKA